MFLWIMAHEIMPSDWFSNCWVMHILMNPMRVGRSIIAYNSFFVALIRYLYIVHYKTANQWIFEKMGRRFQIASIAFPIFMEVIRILSEEDLPGLRSTERFRNCVAENEGLNNTDSLILPTPATVEFSLKFLSPHLVNAMYSIYLAIATLVYSNMVEGYFYLRMYETIQR